MILSILALAILAPKVERLHTGFRYTEGPAVDREGNLYFTDVPAHRIYRRSLSGRLTVVSRTSGGTVGLEWAKGWLHGAQSAKGRVVIFSTAKGAPTTLAGGLGSPNDLAADGLGGLYVTSPDFRGRKADSISFIDEVGRALVIDRTVRNPNGIALSPDGRTLYVVGYATHDVQAFPILSAGRIGPGKRLTKLAGPGGIAANTGGDGMAVGPDGTLYIAIPEARGIHVARPDGRFVAFYPLPEQPSNCALSADGRSLFVTAQRSVYAVRL